MTIHDHGTAMTVDRRYERLCHGTCRWMKGHLCIHKLICKEIVAQEVLLFKLFNKYVASAQLHSVCLSVGEPCFVVPMYTQCVSTYTQDVCPLTHSGTDTYDGGCCLFASYGKRVKRALGCAGTVKF